MTKSKYFISTNSKKKSDSKRICINGEETNFVIWKNGEMLNTVTGYYRKPSLHESGYYVYSIQLNGKQILLRIHRVLAALFIPIPQKYIDMGLTQLDLEVNHKDGNKNNYDLDNLEWCTQKENAEHANRTGLTKIGSDHHYSLPEETIREILQYFKDGLGYTAIKRKTGITASVIRDICMGNHWSKHIRDEYDLDDVHVKGERISEETVREICKLLETGDYCLIEVAEKLNISKSYIDAIIFKGNHVDIACEYDLTHIPKVRHAPLARQICELLQYGKSNKEIREITGAPASMVIAIKTRAQYRSISKDYVW